MNGHSPELKLELLRTCCSHGDVRSLLSLSQTSASFFGVYCNNGPRLLHMVLDSMCTSKSRADALYAIALARLPTRYASVTETYILEEIEHVHGENFRPSRMVMLRAISRYRIIRRLGCTVAKQCNLVHITTNTYVAATYLLLYRILAGGCDFDSRIYFRAPLVPVDTICQRLLQDGYDTTAYSEYNIEKAVHITANHVVYNMQLSSLNSFILHVFPGVVGTMDLQVRSVGELRRALERDWRCLIRLVTARMSYDGGVAQQEALKCLIQEGAWLPPSEFRGNKPDISVPDGAEERPRTSVAWFQRVWARVRRP